MQGSRRTSGRASFSASERAALLFFSCIFAFGAACKRGGERPVVSVQVVDRAGIGVDASERIDQGELRRIASRAIEALGGFEVRDAKSGEIAWQLLVTVQLTAERNARPDDAGVVRTDEVYRRAAVSIDLSQLSTDPSTGQKQRLIGNGVASKNVRVFDGFAALFPEAMEAAVKDVAVELELARASEDEVLAKLRDPNPRTQARAIEAAGERKISKSVPVLIELLGDDAEEPDVVFKTIGALIQIKDPRAVGPLIDSARRRSPIYLGQIIFGVAQIGGREAEAYLFTVASGHPDAEVRKSAQDALDEMHRAGSKGAKGEENKDDG
jgi:hypothetical protein